MRDSEQEPDGRAVETIDFDEWSALHRRDPLEFERRRKALLDEAIAAAPTERRAGLVAMLERFDATATGLSPTERAHAASVLAVESLQALGDELAALAAQVDGTSAPRRGPTKAREQRAAPRTISNGERLLH